MADAMLTVEVIADMNRLSAGLKSGISDLQNFANQANGILNGVKAGTTSANASLTQLGTTARNTQNNLKNVGGGTSSNLSALTSQFLSLGAAIGSIKYAFDQNIAVDSIKTSLTYLLGSSEEMESRFGTLREKANAYGLELTGLGQAYQLFIGSAKAANQDLEVAEKVFYSLSKAGAVLHLSQDKVKSALYAVQQMMDKGTVQSEELRRQLGNALPGAMAIMAKAVAEMTGKTSVSNDELMKMMKTGKLISSEVLPFFAEQIEKTFGIESVEKVESLQASVGRLKNAMTDLVADGSGVSTFFGVIVDSLANVTTSFNKLFNSTSFKEVLLRLAALNTSNPVAAIISSANADTQNAKTARDKQTPVQRIVADFKLLPKEEQLAMIKERNAKREIAYQNAVAGGKQFQINLLKHEVDVVSALRKEYDRLYKKTEPLVVKGSAGGSAKKTGSSTKFNRNDQIDYKAPFDLNGLRNTDSMDDFVADYLKSAELLDKGSKDIVKSFNVVNDYEFELTDKEIAFAEFVEGMQSLTEQFAGDIVFQFAEGIGQMMAGDMTAVEFGAGLIESVGNFLSQIGKQMIAFGVTAILFTKLKAAIVAGGPAAIPASIALIAAGAAMVVIGSAISSAVGGGNSGSGETSRPNKIRGYASGGRNIPGGLAWVGERGPELMHVPNGANITPNHQLNGLMGSAMGSGMNVSDFKLTTSISMGQLYVELEREKRKSGRLG